MVLTFGLLSFFVIIDKLWILVIFLSLQVPIFPPTISPLGSSLKKTKAPPPSPLLVLPPPPPNTGIHTLFISTFQITHILTICRGMLTCVLLLFVDCSSVTCTEPLTYTPTGSPCGCVLPMQVKLRLGIAIYTFFPLVSELAEEIAASVTLNHSQVRIMGADAASQQLEKTVVLVNLVPKGFKFDYTTAFAIYEKFWRRQVLIEDSRFGSYEVLYVHYPGLEISLLYHVSAEIKGFFKLTMLCFYFLSS